MNTILLINCKFYRNIFNLVLIFSILVGCSGPKFGLKELKVIPQYYCSGDIATVNAKFGQELDKIVIKDKHQTPLKVFKDKKSINWTTPPLNEDIVQFIIRGHLESWGSWKRKTYHSDFINIDNPTWTTVLKDVQYGTTNRVETINHDPGSGPVPEEFGYYECNEIETVWNEVCEPIYDCAEECDEDWNCEEVCYIVGENCWMESEDICLSEEFVNEPYQEHKLYITLHDLSWSISSESFSNRARTLKIQNLNSFPIVSSTDSWNLTIQPNSIVSTPNNHPGQFKVTGQISPPVEVLCAIDYTRRGDKADFDNISCDFEDLIGGISLNVYCGTAP